VEVLAGGLLGSFGFGGVGCFFWMVVGGGGGGIVVLGVFCGLRGLGVWGDFHYPLSKSDLPSFS